MVFSDMETPSPSEDDDHQPTAEDRLFNAIRKKSKINKPFTEEDRIQEIRKCLSEGSDINAPHTSDAKKCTILHIAVLKDFKEVVEFLVHNGADIDIRNGDNETPLDIAKKRNNIEIITLLGGQVESENDEAINSYNAKDKSVKGWKDGLLYEKLLITLLSAKGFENFRVENPEYNLLGVGREVKIDERFKFDDVVFVYPDHNNPKNIIFVQSKHKENYRKINSRILSSPASSTSDMARNFNLEKYFISYLKARENLKNAKSDMVKNGKIKYFVFFTTAVLDIKDLEKNGFRLKKAPADIISLLNALKSENDCHQLEKLSDKLQKKLEKHSDFHKLAKELAKCIVDEHYKNELMTMEDTIQHYHVVLGKEVITVDDNKLCRKNKQHSKRRITDYILSCMYNVMHVLYHIWFIFISFPLFFTDLCINRHRFKTIKWPQKHFKGYFKDEFIDDEDEGSKRNLRNAIFHAIKELDRTKENASSEELKTLLRKTELKLPQSFGKSNQEDDTALPTDDVIDFLNCLIYIVNQPYADEYEKYVNNIVQDIILRKSLLKPVAEKFGSFGPDIRKRLEKILTIDKKAHSKEFWISEEEIVKIIQEKAQLIDVFSLISVITIIYENDIMKWGLFTSGQITDTLDNFFLDNEKKVLCINTPETSLSSIKMLQYFSNKEGYRAEDGRISVNLNDLISKGYQNIVVEAFKLENSKLLTIECPEIVEDVQNQVEKFYKELSDVIKEKSEKKIILIIKQDRPDILNEMFMADFQNTIEYSSKIDYINIEDFKPNDDPLRKEVILFQEQNIKVSFATLTGISDWDKYIELSKMGDKLLDIPTFVKLLNNYGTKVGSKPLRTSSLEGAYAKLYQEINIETFITTLSSQIRDNMSNDRYIISGINGSHEEKSNQLIRCLRITHCQEEIKNQVGYIARGKRIEIVDDQYKEKDFVQVCHIYPEKNIFWIIIKNEGDEVKIILHQIYNPKFYLMRKFKKIDELFIKADIKELLKAHDLSEIFIFSGINDQEEFIQLFRLDNEDEKRYINYNCNKKKIKLFACKELAEEAFEKLSKKMQTQNLHWLKFEDDQLVWCKSRGSLEILRSYIDKDKSQKIIEEGSLIQNIKDEKAVIIADDPGMGKSTTLTRLYESHIESESIIESHWVIRINLRDYYEAIKDIEVNTNDITISHVIDFLSKVDMNLNNCLAKALLKIALDKNEFFLKPLLIVFDGFDELLNEEDRNKVILLLEFLKNKTEAKFWISTRKRYKQTLENNLCIFAIEFDPMDAEVKIEFVKNFFKDRLCLILSEEEFEKVRTNIHNYAKDFLKSVESVFQGNISDFLGTPLQLCLMLEGSLDYFRDWIETGNTNFDFFGKNIWEVYEKFTNAKYEIYFKKANVTEQLQKRLYENIFDQYIKNIVKSSIIKSKLKESLTIFKNLVLSTGIIKSSDTVIEFIHPTFREFFAAQLFIHYIEKVPNDLSNTQILFLKEISTKPLFELVRNFISIKLKAKIEAGSENSLQNYGEVISKIWGAESTTDADNGTVLHTAVDEKNKDVISFIFHSLNRTSDCQRKLFDFLKIQNTCGETALHRTVKTGNYEIIKLVFSRVEEKLSSDQLYILFNMKDKNCNTILDYYYGYYKKFASFYRSNCFAKALKLSFELDIFILLDIAVKHFSEKQLIEFVRQTDLHKAVRKNDYNTVMSILNRDVDKDFLFTQDYNGKTALHYAVEKKRYKLFKAIRNKAKQILSTRELCQFFCLQDHSMQTVLHLAVNNYHYKLTKLILNTGKYSFPEGFCEFLSIQDYDYCTALHIAAKTGFLYKVILKKTQKLDIDQLQNFLQIKDSLGCTYEYYLKFHVYYENLSSDDCDYSSEEAESDNDEYQECLETSDSYSKEINDDFIKKIIFQ